MYKKMCRVRIKFTNKSTLWWLFQNSDSRSVWVEAGEVRMVELSGLEGGMLETKVIVIFLKYIDPQPQQN